MKRLMVVAAAAAVLGGCQSAAFGVRTNEVLASQRPATKAEVDNIIDAMRTYLVDPYSVRDAEISNVVNLNGVPTVCVKANAKNRMGGYTGRQTVMVYMNNQGRPYATNGDVFAVSGCDMLQYRRFYEVERLKAL